MSRKRCLLFAACLPAGAAAAVAAAAAAAQTTLLILGLYEVENVFQARAIFTIKVLETKYKLSMSYTRCVGDRRQEKVIFSLEKGGGKKADEKSCPLKVNKLGNYTSCCTWKKTYPRFGHYTGTNLLMTASSCDTDDNKWTLMLCPPPTSREKST